MAYFEEMANHRSKSQRDGPGKRMWFKDFRSGGEKQAFYLNKIQHLQQKLVDQETHHLIHAMERIENFSPIRKSTVLDEDIPHITEVRFQTARPSVRRKPEKTLLPHKQDFVTSSDSDGLELTIKSKGDEFEFQGTSQISGGNYYFTKGYLPSLTDKDIARIVVKTTGPVLRKAPLSVELLQTNLPSIPTVGPKSGFLSTNRLKALTLADSEFLDEQEYRRLRGIAKPRSSKSKRDNFHALVNPNAKKSKSKKKSSLKHKHKVVETVNVQLHFDVTADDPIFKHCNRDKSGRKHVNKYHEEIEHHRFSMTPSSRPPSPTPTPLAHFEDMSTVSVTSSTRDRKQSSKKNVRIESPDLRPKTVNDERPFSIDVSVRVSASEKAMRASSRSTDRMMGVNVDDYLEDQIISPTVYDTEEKSDILLVETPLPTTSENNIAESENSEDTFKEKEDKETNFQPSNEEKLEAVDINTSEAVENGKNIQEQLSSSDLSVVAEESLASIAEAGPTVAEAGPTVAEEDQLPDQQGQNIEQGHFSEH